MEGTLQDEVQIVETVTVSQRKGGCCIHQSVITTLLVQADEKVGELVAAALRQIDDSDYDLVAEQVTAIEAVVALVKQIMDAAMSRENRVEKLEKEPAEVKRELERCRQDRWPWAKTLGRTVAVTGGVLLSDGLRSRLRGVRNLLNLILKECLRPSSIHNSIYGIYSGHDL